MYRIFFINVYIWDFLYKCLSGILKINSYTIISLNNDLKVVLHPLVVLLVWILSIVCFYFYYGREISVDHRKINRYEDYHLIDILALFHVKEFYHYVVLFLFQYTLDTQINVKHSDTVGVHIYESENFRR